MKFSNKSGYGLQAMVRLANLYQEDKTRVLPLAELTDIDDISESYLERVMRILRKQGLVKSVQGRKGGYKLGKDPKNITAKEILLSLEGNLFPYKCVCGCSEEHCLTKNVWHKLYFSITKTLDNITLFDLISH